MKKKILFLALILVSTLVFPSFTNFNSIKEVKQVEVNYVSLKCANYWNNFTYIHINGNWSTAVSLGWIKGDGSINNPFLLENLTINATKSPTKCGIIIQNSKNYYFTIKNVTVFTQAVPTGFYDAGIKLDNSNNGTIIQNNCSRNSRGIVLLNCENTTIRNNTVDKCDIGIFLDGAKNANVSRNTFDNCTTAIGLLHIFGTYDNLNISLSRNNMTNCGIYVTGDSDELKTLNIDTTNTVNSKPIYFYFNCTGLKSTNFTNAGQIILHYVNNSVIKDQTLTHTNIGITLTNCVNNTITNTTVSIIKLNGIILTNCQNTSIRENIIENTLKQAIYIRGNSKYNNLTKNKVSSNTDAAISLEDSFNNTVSNNSMINSGLTFSAFYQKTKSNVIDSLNTVNNKSLYYFENKLYLGIQNFSNAGQIILRNCQHAELSDLNVSQGSVGIAIYHSNNITLNTIASSNNNYYGFYLYGCSNSSILNSTVNSNVKEGLYVYNCFNTSILDSRVNSNLMRGIYVKNSDNTTINGTRISYNSIYGVYLTDSSNCSLTFNNISFNSQYGVYLFTFDSNSLQYNSIYNNSDGIYVDACDKNIFFSNSIVNNSNCGMNVSDSISVLNLFYNNTFARNLIDNAFDFGTNTQWDNGTLGNCWDDYIGKDANDDGIGDTPYNIAGGTSQDNKPLWWDSPDITISEPLNWSTFGKQAGAYSLTVEEGRGHSFWYQIIGEGVLSSVIPLSGNLNEVILGTFEQSSWNTLINGSYVVRFYVNDTRGLFVFEDAVINIDKISPYFVVSNIVNNTEYISPPSFLIFIQEPHLDTMWYSLNAGTNHTFTDNGTIDSGLWNTLADGTVVICFYVNDTAGNVNWTAFSVLKKTVTPEGDDDDESEEKASKKPDLAAMMLITLIITSLIFAGIIVI